MMKKFFLVSLAVLFVSVGWNATAQAAEEGSYNFMTAEVLKTKIEGKEALTLVDIQVENEFDAHHIPGAVATYAYPVKSDEDRGRLDAILPTLKAGGDPVVIVCPRGAGGAKRAYDYLQGKGVAAERLVILEKGQEGWPYPELTEKKGN